MLWYSSMWYVVFFYHIKRWSMFNVVPRRKQLSLVVNRCNNKWLDS